MEFCSQNYNCSDLLPKHFIQEMYQNRPPLTYAPDSRSGICLKPLQLFTTRNAPWLPLTLTMQNLKRGIFDFIHIFFFFFIFYDITQMPLIFK